MVNIPLRYMDDIFVTYIMLYIICTIENDTFDLEWIKEA